MRKAQEITLFSIEVTDKQKWMHVCNNSLIVLVLTARNSPIKYRRHDVNEVSFY